MRRRNFIALLGSAATWPLAAHAQQPTKHIVGVLSIASPGPSAPFVAAFQQGLDRAGFVEGGNVLTEFRWAEGRYDRLPTLAHELIDLKPEVIVANTTAVTLAVRRVTATIPTVCVTCTDPVGMGLVKGEARPGTNVTGSLTRVEGMTGKQLDVAIEAIPGLNRIGVLANVDNPSNLVQRRELEVAASKLGLSLVLAEAKRPSEIYPAFQMLTRSAVKMVLVLQDGMFVSERKRIALFAVATKLPTMSSFAEMVEDGGLISVSDRAVGRLEEQPHYMWAAF